MIDVSNYSEGTGKEGEVRELLSMPKMGLIAQSYEQHCAGQKLMKIRDQVNKRNFVIGVYYRPLSQGEDLDEESLLQLQEVSCLHTLVLIGNFKHPDIC